MNASSVFKERQIHLKVFDSKNKLKNYNLNCNEKSEGTASL